jgi:hypothetical protein
MIKLNLESLRSSYVNILKVTNQYIYVVNHRSGELYRPSKFKQEPYGRNPDTGQPYMVSKVPVNTAVAMRFASNNGGIREFVRPRLASINLHEQDIISLEVQPQSSRLGGAFSAAENWQSGFSRVLKELQVRLENPSIADEVHFNGTEIFWTAPKESESFHETDLDHKQVNGFPEFSLRQVEYVPVGTMGLSILRKINERKARLAETQAEQNNGEAGAQDLMNRIESETATLRPKIGFVMVHRPDANDASVETFSPVIGFALADPSAKKEAKESLRGLYQICSESNPAFINLDFVLTAGKTIKSLYGSQKTDFFDMPSILEEIGELQLEDVHPESRKAYPTTLSAKECVAWLMDFTKEEERLGALQDLNKTIRTALIDGIIIRSNMEVKRLPGVANKPLPMISLAQALTTNANKFTADIVGENKPETSPAMT